MKNIFIIFFIALCCFLKTQSAAPNTPIAQAQAHIERIKRILSNPQWEEDYVITWAGKDITPLNRTGRRMLQHQVHSFKKKYLDNGNFSTAEKQQINQLLQDFLNEYP